MLGETKMYRAHENLMVLSFSLQTWNVEALDVCGVFKFTPFNMEENFCLENGVECNNEILINCCFAIMSKDNVHTFSFKMVN